MIIKFGFYADRNSKYFQPTKNPDKIPTKNPDNMDEDDEEPLKPNQVEFGHIRKYIAQIEYFHEEPDTQYQLFNAYPNHEIAFDVACAHLCKEDSDRTDLLDSLLNKTTAESNENIIIKSIIQTLAANPLIKLGVIAMDYAGNYINKSTHTFKTLADVTSHFSNIVYEKRDYAKQKCYENENAIVISAFMMKGKDQQYGNETNELKGFINIDAHEGNYLVNIPKRFIDEGKDSRTNQTKRSQDDPNQDFRVFAIDTGNVITMNYLDRLDEYTKNNYKTLTGRNYDYDYAFIKWIIIHWNITEDNLTGKETFIPNNMRLIFLHFINTFIISIEFILSYENDRENVSMGFHESPSSHIAKYLIEKDKDHRIWDCEFIKEMVDLLNQSIIPNAVITIFGGWNTHYPTVIENIQENHLKNPVKIHPNIIDKYMRIYEYMTVINPKLPREWMKLPNELLSIKRERDDDEDKPRKKKQRQLPIKK
jgi:hypothetical protein